MAAEVNTGPRPYSDPEPIGRAEYEQAYWGDGYASHWDDLDDATRAEWAAKRVEEAPPLQKGSIWSWQAGTSAWLEVSSGRAADIDRMYASAREYGVTGAAFVLLPRGQRPVGGPAEMDAPVVQADPEPVAQPAPAMPPAWWELIEALHILAKAQTDEISPFHCEHDRLTVSADPRNVSPTELSRLEEIGFHADDDPDGGFYSYRYGSA